MNRIPFDRNDFQPDPEQRAENVARNARNEARWVEERRAQGAIVSFQDFGPWGRIPVAEVEG